MNAYIEQKCFHTRLSPQYQYHCILIETRNSGCCRTRVDRASGLYLWDKASRRSSEFHLRTKCFRQTSSFSVLTLALLYYCCLLYVALFKDRTKLCSPPCKNLMSSIYQNSPATPPPTTSTSLTGRGIPSTVSSGPVCNRLLPSEFEHRVLWNVPIVAIPFKDDVRLLFTPRAKILC